jgi:hypothetical protein
MESKLGYQWRLKISDFPLWIGLVVLCILSESCQTTVVGSMFLSEYWTPKNTTISIWHTLAALANLVMLFWTRERMPVVSFYVCLLGVLVSWIPVFYVIPILPYANVISITAAFALSFTSKSECGVTESIVLRYLPILLYLEALSSKLYFFS